MKAVLKHIETFHVLHSVAPRTASFNILLGITIEVWCWGPNGQTHCLSWPQNVLIMYWTWGLSVAVAVTRSLAAPPVQVPLRGKQVDAVAPGGYDAVGMRRPLHGRFLHITGT